MLLRIKENIDEHAVLSRMLIGGEVGRDVEAPGESRECPRVDIGCGHSPREFKKPS